MNLEGLQSGRRTVLPAYFYHDNTVNKEITTDFSVLNRMAL